MRILIAYAGKTGTTAKCAAALQKRLPGAALADLNVENPRLLDYDAVIVGGAVRMGRSHPQVRRFLKANEKILLKKKTAYFFCCASPENCENYSKASIPPLLREKAAICLAVGGEIRPEKIKGLDSVVIRMVSKSMEGRAAPRVEPERLDELAELFRE